MPTLKLMIIVLLNYWVMYTRDAHRRVGFLIKYGGIIGKGYDTLGIRPRH